MLIKSIAAAGTLLFTVAVQAAPAPATAPAELKIGTLYASSGNLAAVSSTVFSGLKFWIDQKNAEGGVFVKPYNKKIPIKLIAYDDQSNTATAATLYNQLITQDKVDILISDSTSVLTSVAVPIARDNKMLLINHTGTGASMFSKDNPYMVLTAIPSSTVWPKHVAGFLTNQGPALGIKRIALIYATNDFTGTQATAIRNFIKASGAPVEIVFDQGVPTTTTNYSVLINNIKATNPDAVVQLGYVNNDIAFLRNLQDAAVKFKFLFAIYPGLETGHVEHTAGPKAMEYVYTYVSSTDISYKPDVGLAVKDYRQQWEKKNAGSKLEFGFNTVAGYTTGLVVESALKVTDSMEQLALRKAIGTLSGKLKTLDGTFEIDESGAQIGEITPLGQLIPDGKGANKLITVFPLDLATGKPVYPAK